MENSDESQLTQEEIDAIAEEFSDKEASIINPSTSAARVKSHDLTSQDSSLGFSNNSIDLLNEFLRLNSISSRCSHTQEVMNDRL